MTIDQRGRLARLPVVEATEAADALRQRMQREFGWVCQVPEYLETVELA